MAKNQMHVDHIKAEALKPLFAMAGATEVAVERARAYAAEAQKSAQARIDAVQARVSQVERDPKVLQEQALNAFSTRVDVLAKEARYAQIKFESRITDLQNQLEDAIKELNDTVADLANRGEQFVSSIRKDGVKAVAVTSSSFKKAPAKKTTAKKAPAGKTTAQKAPAKKVTAKKAATKSA